MDTKSIHSINQEELEETLSLCDLSLEEDQNLDDQSLTPDHRYSPNSPSHDHEFFEFPFILNDSAFEDKENGIVFCGKLVKDQRGLVDGAGDQSRHTKQFKNDKNDLGSLYLVDSKPISSLSSKSFMSRSWSSSRKHKVLIGVTKIPSKMELSDLRKRQSRRNHPLPMFPPVDTETDDGCFAGSKRRHLWSLLRSLRRKAHIFNALGKTSLGCIPHV